MNLPAAVNINTLHAKSLESQSQFRIILDALSYPGKAYDLSHIVDGSKSNGAMNALINALCDYEVSLFFDSEFNSAASADWFRYGLKINAIADSTEADFIAIPAKTANNLGLSTLKLGSLESPHLGSTLFIEVDSFTRSESAFKVRAVGAGIETQASFSITGLSHQFWSQRINLQASFPTGVDIFFCCGSQVIALPRSTRIETES